MPSRKSLLFLGYMILFGSLTGLSVTNLSAYIPIPKLSLFCFGLAMTPLILGHWVLLATRIKPKWTNWWLALLLLIIELPFAIYSARGWNLSYEALLAPRYLDIYAIATGGVFAFYVLKTLFANSKQSNNNQDANLYIGQAKLLLESRSLKGLTDFETNLWNVAPAHHGLSYSGYIAFARSFAGIQPEWDKDDTVKIAFQFNFVCYIFSLFALSYSVLGTLWGAIVAVLLVARVQNHQYICQAFSRDPYRLSSGLFFAGVLAATVSSASTSEPIWLVMIFLLTYCTLDTHTLGSILIIILGSCWTGSTLLADHISFFATLAGCLAIAVGSLLAGVKYIKAYRTTGTLWGNIPIRYAVQGTVLDERVEQKAAFALQAQTRRGKFKYVMQSDNYILPVTGTISSIAIISLSLVTDIPYESIFISMAALLLLLPMVGAFDFSHYKISDWFSSSRRYILHWYPFLSISFIILLTLGINQLTKIFPDFKIWMFTIPLLQISLAYSLRAIEKWNMDIPASHNRFRNYVEVLNSLVKLSPKEGSIVLSQYTYAPYMQGVPAYLYTKPYWPVLQAPTPEAAKFIIHRKKIKFFVFEDRDVVNWINLLPLYAALQTYGKCVYKGNTLEVWTCG